MPNDAKNINTTSIEDLVNSSLDIAAEEMLKESSSTKNDIKQPDKADIEALTEEELTMEPQTEVSMLSKETLKATEHIATEPEEMPEEFDLDEPLDLSVIESETELETASEPDIQATVELAELSEQLAIADTDLVAKPIESDPLEITDPSEAIEALVQPESIDALENEVSELEAEIQTQMDKLVVKADHLKANIQSELKRVSADNEQLQQQVSDLVQQLSDAEEKIQSLAEVQDRQQATIQKLIKILKGVNTKITHLYDEK
ncbi:MAG: hypothetical protein P1P78_13420 [Methyloprofundus sp.]|nr:hypothetical protein [Methyloprofundus sp.]